MRRRQGRRDGGILLCRAVGHGFGAAGAAAALDVVVTAIDPYLARFADAPATPLQLLAGGLSGLGLVALGAWVVAQADHGRDPPRMPGGRY